jgi:hypothetical protein
MRAWRQIERERKKFIKKGASKGIRVLTELRRELFNSWQNNTSIYDFERYSLSRENVKAKMTDVFNSIYVDTGSHFARMEYRSIKSDMIDLQTKDDSMLWGLWRDRMLKFVAERCGLKIESTTRTLFENIERITRNVIREAALNGYGADKVADMILSQYNNMAKWQALRIARTEVVGASNEGAFTGAGSLGIELNKVWLSALKENTREDHSALDHTEVPQDEPFDVGGELLMYPGDPSGSAGNVINCLCAISHRPAYSLIDELLNE